MKSNGLQLDSFHKISLEELNKVKLRNRQDTKFIFNQNTLPLLLEKIKPFYRILRISGDHTFTYENTYFDTDGLQWTDGGALIIQMA